MKKSEILDLFDISGKTAIITGATGGFGYIAAKTLAAMGVNVMLTGRGESKLNQFTKEINAFGGGKVAYVTGDPVKKEDAEKVVNKTVETFGGIDILITSAGTNANGPIDQQAEKDWEMVIDANVKGTYQFCKEAGKVMKKQGRGGKVILLGSVRGQVGIANFTAYCSSKGAIHMMTKALACEWTQYKINVNCLAPAVFRTEITKPVYENKDIHKMILGHFPAGGRLGEPEDFIGLIVYLCSKASDWMTGAVLNIDGGFTAC